MIWRGVAWPARWLAAPGLLVALSGCRLEAHPPIDARQDLVPAVEATVAGFYQAVAARDSNSLRQLAFAGGTALLDGIGTNKTVAPLASLLATAERRIAGQSPRLLRSEIHLEGGVATVRVLLVKPTGDGLAELEATDILILGLQGGMWRVAFSQLGQWRIRQAP